MAANDHRAARALWSGLEPLVPLLFREANPMPIKYLLWRRGLIASPECRLPLSQVSEALAVEARSIRRARPGLRPRPKHPTGLPCIMVGCPPTATRW